MKPSFFIFLLTLSFYACSSPMKSSDHFDGKKFHNVPNLGEGSFFGVLKWKLNSDKKEWPEHVAIKNYPFRTLTQEDNASATFINHATFLIQLPGTNILTDPVYSERTSPVTFAGPKRVKAPGIPLELLPKIDIVIVSHNHYDHLDLETLKKIDGKFHPLFLVALGDAKLLKKNGIQNVKEMDWWEELQIRDIKVIYTPAHHWSARSPFDRNESLWGSFMVKNEKTSIYFGGDTGYSSHFKEIKTRLGMPDLSLLPIGGYAPRWFMKMHHMSPEDAIMAHQDLGSARSVGMHFGTFQLTDEGIDQPLLDLKTARDKLKIPEEAFKALEEGQTLFF